MGKVHYLISGPNGKSLDGLQPMIVLGMRFGDDRRRGKVPGTKSALHVAVQHGGRAAVEAEINSGCPINTFDENCETPLDIAEKNKHKKAIKMLRAHFALTADELASLPPGPPGKYDGAYRAFVVVVTAEVSSRLARRAKNSDDELRRAMIGVEIKLRDATPCYINSKPDAHKHMISGNGAYVRICTCPGNFSRTLKLYNRCLKERGFEAVTIRIAKRSEYESKLDESWHFISEAGDKKRVPDYEPCKPMVQKEIEPSPVHPDPVPAIVSSSVKSSRYQKEDLRDLIDYGLLFDKLTNQELILILLELFENCYKNPDVFVENFAEMEADSQHVLFSSVDLTKLGGRKDCRIELTFTPEMVAIAGARGNLLLGGIALMASIVDRISDFDVMSAENGRKYLVHGDPFGGADGQSGRYEGICIMVESISDQNLKYFIGETLNQVKRHGLVGIRIG